jgi:hypothetical protein
MAKQTPDGRWHHLISARNTALLRNDQVLMRRERLEALLSPAGALAVTSNVLVGVAMMDQVEARQTVEQIKTHLDSARRQLLDLYEREGWRALGYTSWRDCATAEFGQSSAQIYRLLSAAQIEQAIDSPIGEIPESHLREVAKLDTPDQQRQALQAAHAATGGKPTARDVRQAAEQIKPTRPNAPAGWVWRDDNSLRRLADGQIVRPRLSFVNTVGEAEQLDRMQQASNTPQSPAQQPLDPADTLILSQAGWDRVGAPRQKGMTTFYEFRHGGTHEERELAAGEVSFWAAEERTRMARKAAPAPSAWQAKQAEITPAAMAEMNWYDQAEKLAMELLEEADHGSRHAAVTLALALASHLAGDDLTSLAEQLDDATYEALAAYRRAREPLPTLADLETSV